MKSTNQNIKLKKINKTNNFIVPKKYFESLEDEILLKINNQHRSLKNKWLKYAAIASVFVVVALIPILIINNNEKNQPVITQNIHDTNSIKNKIAIKSFEDSSNKIQKINIENISNKSTIIKNEINEDDILEIAENIDFTEDEFDELVNELDY